MPGTNVTSNRIEEPLWRTLRRNLAIAVVVAGGISGFRHDSRGFLSLIVLALWPSLGGHYVEVAFENHIRTWISQAYWVQVVVRLLIWYAGGVLLYLGMFLTSQALPIGALPFRFWWVGGLLFIALELLLHAFLARRGLSDFYGIRR
jgi:hypothetical protein